MSSWLPQSVRSPSQQDKSYSNSISHLAATRQIYDLCTFDGCVVKTERVSLYLRKVFISIVKIPQAFRGFSAPEDTKFYLKSSLAQLGLISQNEKIALYEKSGEALIDLELLAMGSIAVQTLDYITEGCYIGKLFCSERKRVICSLQYVTRLLEQVDLMGEPLIVYGTPGGSDPTWKLEKLVDGRIIAWLHTRPGSVVYGEQVTGLLPTIGIALKTRSNYKDMLRLHQEYKKDNNRVVIPDSVLIVTTYPFHMSTMFGRVVPELLPPGIACSGSNVIEPTTRISGAAGQVRTFVFTGNNPMEITHIPVEFYALEPYREYISFELRKTLGTRCANVNDVCKVFSTAPHGAECACIFICKGGIFDKVNSGDWITSLPLKTPVIDIENPGQQREQAQHFLYQQCEYGILSAISVGDITSEGVLFTLCFPSPILKSLLLSHQVINRIRAIYFIQPSHNYAEYFGHEETIMLIDLNAFGISLFMVNLANNTMSQFMMRSGHSNGMFVPLDRRIDYLNATFLGVYGSNLIAGDFEAELHVLLAGLLHHRKFCNHPLMNPNKPLALVTGGGGGAMQVGNRVAKSLGILSCGMLVDYSSLAGRPGINVDVRYRNKYIEAFMLYRVEKIIERQSDFNPEFPIFLAGGIGTDFEYALEELRRKVGVVDTNPILLFGTTQHWGNKITARYRENLQCGTMKGSEWISTVPWVCSTGKAALVVLSRFFDGTLPIGPGMPTNDRGFMIADDDFLNEKH